MTAGLKCGSVVTEIGPGSILHGLFSTISTNLEPKGWGSRFPLILGKLYQGELPASDAKTALEELKLIRKELSALPISKMVWDIESPRSAPPKEYKPNPGAQTLDTFFYTTTGRDLLYELEDNVQCAIEMGFPVKVISYSSPLEFFNK